MEEIPPKRKMEVEEEAVVPCKRTRSESSSDDEEVR